MTSKTLLRWHSAGVELNTSQYATLADVLLDYEG